MSGKMLLLMKPLLGISLIWTLGTACQQALPAASPLPSNASSPSNPPLEQTEKTQVEVKYSPLKNTPQQIKKTAIPNKILKSIALTNGKLLVFQNKETDETLLYGYQGESGIFYEVGPIGSITYKNKLSAGEASVFGKSLIWIKGLSGANSMISDFIEIKDGAVYPFLHLEKDVQIVDADHDGENELLTQTGSPYTELSIIKWKDDSLQELSINQALGAEQGVQYNSQTGLFSVGYPNNEIRTYRLDTTTFTLSKK
ncbi:hypothetical protein [Paenibacillus humicus]|uniref:hypothetical protein n=1 Tax=Paenibacillus humicus TaxID=412861 RepID=UPI003F14D2A1